MRGMHNFALPGQNNDKKIFIFIMEAKVSFVTMRGMHNFAQPGQNNKKYIHSYYGSKSFICDHEREA